MIFIRLFSLSAVSLTYFAKSSQNRIIQKFQLPDFEERVLTVQKAVDTRPHCRLELDAEFSGDETTQVSDVTHDSRQARQGTLFAPIRGLTTDGHRFINDVVRRGAVGVISESDAPADFPGLGSKSKTRAPR
jgi:hypothetical protein